MRRFAVLLALLAPVLQAGEAPLIVIRKPDGKTRRELDKLVSSGLNSSGWEARRAARQRLVDIGPWSVTPLSLQLLKRSRSERIRQNAAITLALIGDELGLPALRFAADGEPEAFVAISACLALGKFESSDDRDLLRRQFDDQKLRCAAAAAIALAKLGDAPTLLEASRILPADRQLAAATLIGAAITHPKADCVRHLGHKDDLVRRAAATGLMIRPLQPEAEAVLLDLLKRPPRVEKPGIRALQFLALARGRSTAVRERLLEAASKEREKKAVRTAAVIGHASRFGDREAFPALRKAYRRITGRSDPLNGPLLFAIARTGHPDAVDFLWNVARQTGEAKRSFYAAGSLIHLVAFHAHPRADEILRNVAELKAKDPDIARLAALAQSLRYHSGHKERAAKAREGFKVIADDVEPYHLWDWDENGRGWGAVNRLLPRIFLLDAIADRANPENRKLETPGKGGGGGGDEEAQRQGPEGRPEEQDLYDLLASEPYFTPEDLGAG